MWKRETYAKIKLLRKSKPVKPNEMRNPKHAASGNKKIMDKANLKKEDVNKNKSEIDKNETKQPDNYTPEKEPSEKEHTQKNNLKVVNFEKEYLTK